MLLCRDRCCCVVIDAAVSWWMLLTLHRCCLHMPVMIVGCRVVRPVFSEGSRSCLVCTVSPDEIDHEATVRTLELALKGSNITYGNNERNTAELHYSSSSLLRLKRTLRKWNSSMKYWKRSLSCTDRAESWCDARQQDNAWGRWKANQVDRRYQNSLFTRCCRIEYEARAAICKWRSVATDCLVCSLQIQRVKAAILSYNQGKAFSGWREQASSSKRQSEIVRRAVGQLCDALVGRALCGWRLAAEESKQQADMMQMHSSVWRNHNQSKAFSGWREQARSMLQLSARATMSDHTNSMLVTSRVLSSWREDVQMALSHALLVKHFVQQVAFRKLRRSQKSFLAKRHSKLQSGLSHPLEQYMARARSHATAPGLVHAESVMDIASCAFHHKLLSYSWNCWTDASTNTKLGLAGRSLENPIVRFVSKYKSRLAMAHAFIQFYALVCEKARQRKRVVATTNLIVTQKEAERTKKSMSVKTTELSISSGLSKVCLFQAGEFRLLQAEVDKKEHDMHRSVKQMLEYTRHASETSKEHSVEDHPIESWSVESFIQEEASRERNAVACHQFKHIKLDASMCKWRAGIQNSKAQLLWAFHTLRHAVMVTPKSSNPILHIQTALSPMLKERSSPIASLLSPIKSKRRESMEIA